MTYRAPKTRLRMGSNEKLICETHRFYHDDLIYRCPFCDRANRNRQYDIQKNYALSYALELSK